MKRISTVIANKLSNGARYLVVHKCSGIIPFFLVTEYPKSGGTWLGQLISTYFDLPFPRNRFPVIGKSLFHGHYLPSAKTENIKQIFWLVRDGRDVMVSSYYYYLFPTEFNLKNPKDHLYYSKKLGFKDVADIKHNLPQYIEFMSTHKPGALTRFGFEGNWSDFNRKWIDYAEHSTEKGNIIKTSYERLLINTEEELERIVSLVSAEPLNRERIKVISDQFSFRNQAGRKQGEENKKSFLRKGVAGDWKNHFSREAAEIFHHYAGEMLIELGYEPDHQWVSRVE